MCLFLSTFCTLSTTHTIFPLHCSYFFFTFLPQYDTNSRPETTAEIKIKMIIHYENKLTNYQFAPQNSDIIDRQSDTPITFSLAQFSIDTSIHLRGLVASASCVKNCKKTPSPLLASDVSQ